jgi:hypothetical protein
MPEPAPAPAPEPEPAPAPSWAMPSSPSHSTPSYGHNPSSGGDDHNG